MLIYTFINNQKNIQHKSTVLKTSINFCKWIKLIGIFNLVLSRKRMIEKIATHRQSPSSTLPHLHDLPYQLHFCRHHFHDQEKRPEVCRICGDRSGSRLKKINEADDQYVLLYTSLQLLWGSCFISSSMSLRRHYVKTWSNQDASVSNTPGSKM